MQRHLEKPRSDAAECNSISDRATDRKKRELFASAGRVRLALREFEPAFCAGCERIMLSARVEAG